MDKFLNLLVSGAVSGAIYSLIASGLALTYATTGIFNLGFGGIAFTSAFVYFELHVGLHWGIVPAAVVTLVVVGPVLGWVLNKLILGRLSRASEAAKVMAVVGILIALPALGRWAVELLVQDAHFSIPLGDQVFATPGIGPSPVHVWHPFGGLTINSDQVIVFGVAAVLAVGLWVLLRHTRLGLTMRAATDRPELASLMGINRSSATAWAWIVGTTLACIAGIVGAPILNTLSPNAYTMAVFVATAAVVLGGFRSVPLAFAGGLILGVAQNLVAGYATFANHINGFNTSVPFIGLLLALAFLGRRRYRNRDRITGSMAEDTVVADLDAGHSVLRRTAGWLIPAALFFCYLYFVAGSYWLSVMTAGLALSVVFLSFVVVTGLGGMVSLAQATFVTAAGLTAGLLINQYHQPWLVGFVGGTAVAALLGVIVALPALRVGGLALSLATLALAFLGDGVLFQWNYLRGGDEGWIVLRPKFGSVDLMEDKTYASILLGVVLLVSWLIYNLTRSSSGRQMIALRASEPAAASSGISPSMVKLRLFTISAAIAGAGGVLLVTADQHATNVTYVTQVGLVWLASAVLWGVRKPLGAVLAGLTATVFPALLSSGFHLPSWIPGGLSWAGTHSTWLPQALFGLGAIAMAKNPNGIMGGGHKRRPRRAESPAPTPSTEPGPSRATAVPVTAMPRTVANGSGASLHLAQVSAGYGEHAVLTGIDLALTQGTITALVGANGAGKSTLCKTAAGLVMPTAGAIFLSGDDVTKAPAHRRAGRLLLAPEARGVFPSLSVEDNLAIRLPSAAQREAVYEKFPVLGERRRIAAGSLSGGEQQMLTMAPLLQRPPSVLIADEPTLGLAPRIVEQLLELFEQLRAQGTTLLLAEERARGILDIADQIVLLELGQLIWTGPRADLQDEQLAAIFLGSAQEAVAATRGSTEPTLA
ncbi:MAG TPA: ATP-binding cassette domain-containing protein [Jatrophihabitantaceae bacterium]|jgi:ABC-type branched-subunit amino acid transport system ATPase component/branched-subunit amino acid ABC-type transport system permease component